jgi:hypothetical protein
MSTPNSMADAIIEAVQAIALEAETREVTPEEVKEAITSYIDYSSNSNSSDDDNETDDEEVSE